MRHASAQFAHRLSTASRSIKVVNRNKKQAPADEPVGIVIAGVKPAEDAPRFVAFVWGPVPEAELQATAATKAA